MVMTPAAYGKTECGMCDSDNTGYRRTDGDFDYTVEIACYDCQFGCVIHYRPDKTAVVTTHDPAHSQGRCVDPTFWGCPDGPH